MPICLRDDKLFYFFELSSMLESKDIKCELKDNYLIAKPMLPVYEDDFQVVYDKTEKSVKLEYRKIQ